MAGNDLLNRNRVVACFEAVVHVEAYYQTGLKMKFAGIMVEITSIQYFSKIISTIAKLAKNVILRITPSHLYFIMSERSVISGSNMWCEMPQDHFFAEFRMAGLSDQLNEIYMEFETENLSRAFRSSQAAKSVKLKLTKKHVPCLTLEIELPSLHSRSRFVVHDIPVTIVPSRLWDEFQEPSMPEYDMSLCLPSLRVMKNVIERMKNLSSFLVISASVEGSISFKVESDLVSVATHFRNLESPPGAKVQRSSLHDSPPSAEIRVDIRKLHQFLFGKQINPEKTICNIVHGHMLQLFLVHDDVSLQYFLPNIAM